MALTAHQTRAPEAELEPNASSTTDKPISHLHYTEGICGGAARGGALEQTPHLPPSEQMEVRKSALWIKR